jgi:hypothetical protein
LADLSSADLRSVISDTVQTALLCLAGQPRRFFLRNF